MLWFMATDVRWDRPFYHSETVAHVIIGGPYGLKRGPGLTQMRSVHLVQKCLLLGVDRRHRGHHETDAFDPNRKIIAEHSVHKDVLRPQRFGMRSRMRLKPPLMRAKRIRTVGSTSGSGKIEVRSFSRP